MNESIAAVAGLGTALGFAEGRLLAVLFLSLRLGAVFLMTPLLGGAAVPARVRVLFVLGLSATLSFALPGGTPALTFLLTRQPGLMIQAGMSELALGMVLGLGVILAFAIFTVAGQVLDTQIGFGLGRIIDPFSRTSTPLLASAFNQVGLVVFFLVNGHHALLRGLAFSLERFPLGRPWPLEAAFEPMMRQAAGLFTLAFTLAVPVVACLLLVEVAMGALSRNLPQINMLVLGFPIKIVTGLMALAAWATGMGPVMTRVYASIYHAWEGLFAYGTSP